MLEAKANDPREVLRDHLLQADEKAVFRALPHQIAHELRLEPRPTLELLVAAMFDGEAVLHWELVCPICQFRSEEPDWMRNAQHDYSCPACGGTYDVHVDDEAQVTFSTHPRLRAFSPAADDSGFQYGMRMRFPPTTVHELLTVQTFRDWARNEPLTVGEHLEVRRMVVWFSDLTGSTALYARNGDPFAYSLVHQHFDLVFEVINRSEGAVVKTLGDGIMAMFVLGARAVEAAVAAHQALEAFNRQRGLAGDKRLALKIGVHAGPAIMVRLNDRLDYFGTTVNVAARVSDLAEGTQTVLTQTLQADPQVQAIIETAGYVAECLSTEIRGLDQPVRVCRLKKPGAVADEKPGPRWRFWQRQS
jgi:class 3 adenylate cyclase